MGTQAKEHKHTTRPTIVSLPPHPITNPAILAVAKETPKLAWFFYVLAGRMLP